MNKSNAHYWVAIACTAFLVLAVAFIMHPVVEPNSDSLSYLRVMSAFDAGNGSSIGTLAYRIIAAGGGLWTIIGMSKIFGSYEYAWMFLNVFLYVGVVLVCYELVRKIQNSNLVALLSAMFVAGNYAMLVFGLGYYMDVGGWLAYVTTALFVLKYAQSSEQKNLWLAAVAVGIGGLFKEYAFLGSFLIFLFLLYENWRTSKLFFAKIWRPVVIAAIPTAILHGIVYFKYHFTYFDWLASNQAHYIYHSRIIEFIKTFGSLLNFLGLLAVIGLYYFWKSRKVVTDSAAPNRTWVFVVCFFLSMLPILFWPAITQRILFVSAPVAAVLASYLFKRHENRLYLFIPVLIVYVVMSFTMSKILNLVNLPF